MVIFHSKMLVYHGSPMKNASSEDFVVENALPETTWHLAGGFFSKERPK